MGKWGDIHLIISEKPGSVPPKENVGAERSRVSLRSLGGGLRSWLPPRGAPARTASALGIPITTPHVITSAILGVGLSQGRRKVNWDVGARIVWAWILTIPASAAASYIAYRLLAPALVRL